MSKKTNLEIQQAKNREVGQENINKIITEVKRTGGITINETADLLDKHRKVAWKYLHRMKDRGILKIKGVGVVGHPHIYYLSEKEEICNTPYRKQ